MRNKVASMLLGTAAALLVASSALADGSGLPGDYGRPAGDGFPPANPPPQPQPSTSTPRKDPYPHRRGPGIDLALTAAQAIAQGCSQYMLAVSVDNAAGEPILTYIPDRSSASSGFIAMRKGYTAVTFKAPTSQLATKAQQDAAFAAQIKADPSFMAYSGAILLKVGDEIIGAIAVAGAEPGHHDEECALIGLEKIKNQLK
jgi:uncharacterized protein GlcG (DUF336 family)